MRIFSKELLHEDAKAMVELAIIIPFLVFFAFSVFEVNRVMKAHQVASRMSFEMANIVIRQCGSNEAGTVQTSFCIRANMGRIASQFEYLRVAAGFLDVPAMQVIFNFPPAGTVDVCSLQTQNNTPCLGTDYPACVPNTPEPVIQGSEVYSAVAIKIDSISPIVEELRSLLYGENTNKGVCVVTKIF